MSIKTKFGTASIESVGYYRITSTKEGNHEKKLHRLIFEDFYGEIPEGYVIHHKDGNRTNNCIMNLQLMRLGTHTAIHNANREVSDETKAKLSKSHKGIRHPKEFGMNLSKKRNTSGYFRVCKVKKKDVKQGFRWVYRYYDENGGRVQLTSINLDKLKNKVLSKGLEWREINS